MKLARILIAVCVAAAIAAISAAPTLAAGLLVPTDEKVPPLAVKYLRVDATIDNQVATTRVAQEFQNSTSRDLECTYIFPLPKGAAIRDFAMYIGGKRMKGELLDKDKARSVYEEIVRRARDPGLLEYMDSGLLRLRIFPVPAKGTQKVEIEYTQVLPMDDGLAEYVFPLKIGDKASKTLEDFTVSVRIKSGTPLKNIYSPTHEVGVSRPNDREAVVGMETKGALLDRDFQLFYTVSDKDFGLSLMTYRPDPEQPGLFLMLLSPKSEIADAQRLPRDVALVLDTSGSMKDGGKIDQAKRALAFCLDKLDPKDRFAVVQFSTMAQTFADGWTDAAAENVKKARDWVAKFDANGGTNASDALAKALALPFDEARPATILFITDGRPTVDVTDTEALAKFVKDRNKKNLRIFTFGVGDDVNTHLLDRMAADTGGLPEYVRSSEAIDAKMTRLASKMTHPVLTELALAVPGVKIAEMYPKDLPDLFRGSQIVVVGSYTGDGDSAIRLKGRMGAKHQEFVYEGTFPKKATERSFLGPLYAHRKIGYLLDQIRLRGENRELKEEVVRLSLAYGIETPYTSYLVLENEEQYRHYGIAARQPSARADTGGAWRATPAPAMSPVPATTAPMAPPMDASKAAAGVRRLEGAYAFGPSAAKEPAAPRGYGGTAGEKAEQKFDTDATLTYTTSDLAKDTGKTAVDVAQAIQRLRQAETASRDMKTVQQVQQKSSRQFANYRGVWVDQAFQGTEKLTKIKWGSAAYFRLVRERPELREALGQGERVVIVTIAGQAVAIDADQGAEELSDAEMKVLFVK